MKKYEISLDNVKKEMKVKVWGMYEPDDAKNFVEDFTKALSPIQPSEFVLSFDCEELKVSKQEMVPMLEGCFKMYKDLGFKKVLMRPGNNVTLKMQLSRVSRNTGLAIEQI
jgi:hypothetical protein